MIFCPKCGLYRDKKYPNITVKRYVSITAPSYKDMRIALPFIWTAVKDLKRFNADVVHIQTPLGIGWMGIWATKILKVKNIQTYHTYIPDFLVYVKPNTLLGINKITDYINNSKLAKTLSKADIISDSRKTVSFSLNLSRIAKEVNENEPAKNVSKFNDRFGRDYTRLVYNRANLVLTPSEAMKKVLKKQGVKTKIEALSNGIDYDFFKKKTDYHIRKKIVHIGRLGYEKNVDVVIKAFNIAQQSDSDLRLDIFGFGPAEKSLKSLARSLKLNKKVKFHGAYDIKKVSQQLCNFDCFVTASTVETQGIVILEAMASGLPVLGVDKLAIPEVAIDGKNGYISKPFDADGMAINMLKIMESDQKLEQFGRKSLEIAKTHEITKCKDRLVKIYENTYRL
jgi:glycosyltransferase involved in cell wall biosynthesis